jgi:signal peptidase I
MTTYEEEDEAGGGPEEDPDSQSDFDPLLTPWDEPRSTAQHGSDGNDGIAAVWAPSASSPGGHRETWEEAPWWESPPAAPYSAQPQPAWYPQTYPQPQPQHQPQPNLVLDRQGLMAQEAIAVPRRHRRWLVTFREVAETLLLALLIFLAVRASFQNFKVEGHSMDPSLSDGEYLIVNKLTYAQIDLSFLNFLPFFDAGDNPLHYLWGAPDRGDVIVFRAPTSPDRDFIKRIIGLPGDTVEINEAAGEVKVNGSALKEPYILGTTGCTQTCTWTVPKAHTAESRQTCGSDDCYFVLGDNRQNSSDSRQGWLVPKENIVGKSLITYWHHGEPELDLAPNHSVGIADKASAEQ